MDVTVINEDPVPVAIYFDSNNCINQKQPHVNLKKIRSQASELTNKYLPILKLLDIRDDSLVLQNEDNITDRYITESKQYEHKGRKLESSAADLMVSTPDFLFNLTDTAVTVRNRSNIPKYFPPNNVKILPQACKGCLLFFRVFYLNALDFIHTKCGVENYIQQLNDDAKASKNPNLIELIKVTQYVSDFLEKNDTDIATVSMSSTIKVVTVVSVSMDKLKGFRHVKGPTYNNFIINNRDIILTIGDYLGCQNHPSVSVELLVNSETADKYRKGSIKIFIVDKKNKIKERYIPLADKVIEIPRIYDTEIPDGLYLVTYGNGDSDYDKKFIADTCLVCTIDNIKNVDYVYTNEEDARDGANKLKRYTEKIEKEKNKAEEDLIKLKSETATKIEEQKLEYDRKTHEQRLALDKEAADQKTALEKASAEQKAALEKTAAEQKAALEKEALAKRNEYEEREKIQKLEYAEKEKAQKLEYDEKKNEYDKKKLEYEKQLMELKTKHESSSFDRKDHYEEKKYQRDDRIETLKMVGAVAGLLAGGYVLFKKFG